jgi:hypothetical protein
MAQQGAFAEAKNDPRFPANTPLRRLADMALTYLPATLALAVQIVLLMVAYKHVTYVDAAQARLAGTPVNAGGRNADDGTGRIPLPAADETIKPIRPADTAQPAASSGAMIQPAPEHVLISRDDINEIKRLISDSKSDSKSSKDRPLERSSSPPAPGAKPLVVLLSRSAGTDDQWQSCLGKLLPRDVHVEFQRLADEKHSLPSALSQKRGSEPTPRTSPSQARSLAQTPPAGHKRALVVIGPGEYDVAPGDAYFTSLSDYENVDALLMTVSFPLGEKWVEFCATKKGAVFVGPKEPASESMKPTLRRILRDLHPALQ